MHHHSIVRSLWSVSLALMVVACSSHSASSSPHELVASSQSAISSNAPPHFAISLPNGVTTWQAALSARSALSLAGGALVQGGTVANVFGHTFVGGGAIVNGAVVGLGPVDVGPFAVIGGDVSSASTATISPSALVSGTIRSNAQFGVSSVSWTAPTPGASAGNVMLAGGAQQTLSPANYDDLVASTGSTLSLGAGIYYFASLDIEPGAVLSFTGPTVVYVTTRFVFHGSILDNRGDASLLVAYSGTNAVALDTNFTGTLVAPDASLALTSDTYTGAFFANDIAVTGGTNILQKPFPSLPPSSECIGAVDGAQCGSPSGNATCEGGLCVNIACNTSADARTLSVSDDFGGGTVNYTQTTAAPLGGPSTITITITAAGQVLKSETIVGPDSAGITTDSVVYGAMFHGVNQVVATSDGGTVNESIDGRSLQPVPASQFQDPQSFPALIFSDGQAPPAITIDDGVLSEIAAISALAKASSGQCTPPDAVQTLLQARGPFDAPGHSTNVAGLSTCQSCRGHCETTRTACIYAGGVLCGGAAAALIGIPLLAVLVGVGCDITADVTCVSQGNNCEDSCNNIGSGCCPNSCGGPGQCCGQGEQCLDAVTDLCCDVGYQPCPGPRESCVDLAQAVCLASGAGCPVGTPTCGSGPDAVCCPSGNCVGNVCDPVLAITVNVQATQTGPDICTLGTGFTPGATVEITYAGIPGRTVDITRTTTLDQGSSFSFSDFGQEGSLLICSQAQADSTVTITATDGSPRLLGSGQKATATISGAFWCGNFNAGSTGRCP